MFSSNSLFSGQTGFGVIARLDNYVRMSPLLNSTAGYDQGFGMDDFPLALQRKCEAPAYSLEVELAERERERERGREREKEEKG